MLNKLIDIMKENLKKEYIKDPSRLWAYPAIILQRKNGEINTIDGKYPDQTIVEWVYQYVKFENIRIMVIGRMGVKYGNIIDPTTNKPIIKNKSIIIYGKDFEKNIVTLNIIPCYEHRDYRDIKSVETDREIIDLTFKSPDLQKSVSQDNQQFFLTVQFGEEQIYSTEKGNKFLIDPIFTLMDQRKKIFEDVKNKIKEE
jgi:hypothetical protein